MLKRIMNVKWKWKKKEFLAQLPTFNVQRPPFKKYEDKRLGYHTPNLGIRLRMSVLRVKKRVFRSTIKGKAAGIPSVIIVSIIDKCVYQ